MNYQCLALFVGQVVVGVAFVLFAPPDGAAYDLGLLLVGGALGQGLTARTTAAST